MNLPTFISRSLAAIALVFAFQAAADVAHSTPAVWGYDVVSYHNDSGPIRGSGHFTATHEGQLYLFANKENLARFKTSPAQFIPAYNGYCAFGVSVGKKFAADPEVYRIIDGVVYLNLDNNIQADWLKNVDQRIASADKRWTKIVNTDPVDL